MRKKEKEKEKEEKTRGDVCEVAGLWRADGGLYRIVCHPSTNEETKSPKSRQRGRGGSGKRGEQEKKRIRKDMEGAEAGKREDQRKGKGKASKGEEKQGG